MLTPQRFRGPECCDSGDLRFDLAFGYRVGEVAHGLPTPLLLVEVLSATTQRRDLLVKRAAYLERARVPEGQHHRRGAVLQDGTTRDLLPRDFAARAAVPEPAADEPADAGPP